jgi:hypothetical protein
MAEWSAQMRTRYFPNPVPDDFYTGNLTPEGSVGPLQDYYAWEWGGALFVVLDPYRYSLRQGGSADNWSATLGREQYEWFKNTLAASQADFKFVFVHQLVGGLDKEGRGGAAAARYFEWGGYNQDGTWGFDEHRPGWGKPIHQLSVENHVTAVFHGHDHLFAKEELTVLSTRQFPSPARPSTTRRAAPRSMATVAAISWPAPAICASPFPPHR